MIDQIWHWLLEHKELIAATAIALSQLVIFLIKKKPIKVLDSTKTVILNALPYVINSAERILGKGHGEDKLIYCLTYLEQFLLKEYPEIDFKQYRDFAKKGIEEILSTPQKKEIKE